MAMNKDFGAFELKQKIGSGGMASVYLAEQKILHRPVVLKILYPHLAEDENLLLRFEREARAAAMMRHENIVQIIDMGRHEEVAYIAMEFVEGVDLKRWIEAHGTPPIDMALLMLRDIFSGLEHAHGHRVVHRDIKPANIMLTPDGTLKIMDFGLARSGADTNTQMTMVGSLLGTPAYMSPEQAAGQAVDERSDIFSAGVVAYELLGGKRPFEGETNSAVIHTILTVEPIEVTYFNPVVPQEIAAVVRGMLQKDVTKRIQRIGQARGVFEDAIEQMGLHRGKDLLREYVANPDEITEKWRKRRLARHLDQGIYYENMGLGKIDDAVIEFRRVLHLDPNHPDAKQHLAQLEHERVQQPADSPQPPQPQQPETQPPSSSRPATDDATIILPASSAAAAPTPPAPRNPLPAPPAPPATPAAAAKSPAPSPQPSAPTRKDPAGSLESTAPRAVSRKPAPAKPAPARTPEPPKPPKTPKPPKAPRPPRPAPLAAIVAIGAVVVIAIIALFVMLRHPSTPTSAPAPVEVNRVSPEPAGQSAPSTEPQTTSPAPAPPAPSTLPNPAANRAAPSPAAPRTVAHGSNTLVAGDWLALSKQSFATGSYDSTVAQAQRVLAGVGRTAGDELIARELIARAHARNSNHRAAVEAFRQLQAKIPAYTPRSDFDRAERSAFDEAVPTASPSSPAPAPVDLSPMAVHVTAIPYADSLIVDGKLFGQNRKVYNLSLPPGHHEVVVSYLLGVSRFRKSWGIDATAGKELDLKYDFLLELGSITVRAEPTWGAIYLDGISQGSPTPFTISAISTGKHVVSLVREGWTVEGGAQTVSVQPGQTSIVNFKLRQNRK